MKIVDLCLIYSVSFLIYASLRSAHGILLFIHNQFSVSLCQKIDTILWLIFFSEFQHSVNTPVSCIYSLLTQRTLSVFTHAATF